MNEENMVNNQSSEPVNEPTVVPQSPPVVEPTVMPQQAPITEPTVVPQSEPVAQFGTQNNYEAPKKSNKGLIFGIVAVLLIAAAGVGIYFAFFRKVSGKEVVNGTVNMIFQKAIDAAEQAEDIVVIDYKKDIIQSKGNIKASIETTDQELLSQLGGINSAAIDYDIRLDLKTLSGSADLTAKENDKTIATLNTLLKDKILYFKSDALSSAYKVDLSNEADWDDIDISKLPEYNSSSLSNLLRKIKEYVKNAIKDEYITQDEGNYTVDGVNVSGLKTTIKINEERYNEITKSVINSLLSDEQGLLILSEFLMKDKTEVKAELEQSRDMIGKQSNSSYNCNETTDCIAPKTVDTEYNINIYTNKQGKFLAFDLLVGETNSNGITAVSQNGTTVIKLRAEGKVTFKVDYDEKNKEFTWKNDNEGNKNETVKIKFSKDGIDGSFSMDGFKITASISKKVNNGVVDFSSRLGLDVNQDGTSFKGSLEFNDSTTKVDSINELNTSGAKNIETLTDAEAEAASNEIMTAAQKSLIFNMIYNILDSKKAIETAANPSTYSYCNNVTSCSGCSDGWCSCTYNYQGYNFTVVCPEP